MKIVLTGSMAFDQIMSFDGLYEEVIKPDKIKTLSISCLVDKLRFSRGGTAGNIAYSLALLGERPILYASVGRNGKNYVKVLAKLGVGTSLVHFSSLMTASFSVLTDRNNCQVGGFYPGAMVDAASLSIKKFENEDVLVVISAHDPEQMRVQVQECLVLKKRLFYDIGQQILTMSKKDLLTGLEAAELLILNDYEMEMFSEKTELSKGEIVKKTNVCVVTLGDKGSEIFAKKNKWKEIKIAAVKLDRVMDPTGAGDAFRAGFLYGYVRDWDLGKCARLGSVVAAFCVENSGTQEHFFTWEEIKLRYKQNYKDSSLHK